MNVLEVSREDWPAFLDEFSRRWRGRAATVDRQPPERFSPAHRRGCTATPPERNAAGAAGAPQPA